MALWIQRKILPKYVFFMFMWSFSQKHYEKTVLMKQISKIHANMYNIVEFQDVKSSAT